MRRVVQVKPTGKERVIIRLSNGEQLNLSAEQWLKSELKVGAELTAEEMNRWRQAGKKSYYYQSALQQISRRPRSVQEIKVWLKKKKLTADLIDQIVDQLLAKGWLDDAAFAHWWVEQRLAFRPKGKRVLASELRAKGVDPQLITQVLDTVDDQQEQIVALARNRLSRLSGLPSMVVRRRLQNFLLRRGFASTSVRRVVDELLGNRYT